MVRSRLQVLLQTPGSGLNISSPADCQDLMMFSLRLSLEASLRFA